MDMDDCVLVNDKSFHWLPWDFWIPSKSVRSLFRNAAQLKATTEIRISDSGNTWRQEQECSVVPIQLMEIQPSIIHLRILSKYPIPASLESDIAQELSLSLNGALWES